MAVRGRLLAALLALALALTPCAAQAAESASIARSDELQQQYSDHVRSACALDGVLYLCGTHSLFRWEPGEADVTPVELELPPCEEGEDRWIERAFSDGEGLYLLCPVYDNSDGGYDIDRLEVIPLGVDGDAATPGAPVEVDPGELAVDYGDGNLSLAQINGACFAGGKLFLCVFDEVLQGVWALDLEEAEGEFIEFDGEVSGMAACGDQLLLLCDDYDACSTSYWLYDPEAEELSPACEPELWPEGGYGSHNGLAYSEETGRLFYQSSGYVLAVEDFDFSNAKQVAELSTYYSGDALLLPGDLYIFLDSGAVRVRATDPGALPEVRLTVDGGAYNASITNAYDAFTATHPNVSVALGQSYSGSEAVISAMLSGDDSTDIYVVDVDSELFDALRDRGYMLELTDPAITEAVDAMYPPIRDVLTRDGAVVAVPCNARGWVPGFDRDAMEALGLTEADLPQSWPELLAWLPELAATLDEDSGVDILDRNQDQFYTRNDLLGGVLTDWRTRMNARGELDYDNPALAALMQAVLDLDLEALGLPEEPDYDDYVLYGTGEDGDRTLLLNLSVGCTLGNIGLDYMLPAPLSPVEGEAACLPISLSVVFVNPHSKHPEQAQAFLAALLDNLEPEVAYNLSDELNDPLPDPYYATAIEDAQAQLDAAQAQLDAADPEERPAIEANVASLEAYLADLEAERWAISPEAIAWYRAHAANLAVVRYDLLSGADNQTMDELNALSEQLLMGTLAPADFLNVFNQKAQMRAKEGY